MADPAQRFALTPEPRYLVQILVTWASPLRITALFRTYVLWQIQQGFSLMHIDLYDAKYLDHLSYKLNIMVCQGLGQGWDAMQDFKLCPLSPASEVTFPTLSCQKPSVHLHRHLFRLPTSACWHCQGAGAPQDTAHIWQMQDWHANCFSLAPSPPDLTPAKAPGTTLHTAPAPVPRLSTQVAFPCLILIPCISGSSYICHNALSTLSQASHF